MTVAIETAPLSSVRPPGRTFDRAFRGVAFVAGALVLVILALIAVTMVVKAWPAFRAEGLSYFTGDVWDPQSKKFGTLAFAFGTVVVSAIAVVIAVPVSIGIALFITEVAPRWLRTPIVYVIDLLAAVPSVVYGLWGVLVLAPGAPRLLRATSPTSSATIPVLGTLFSATRSARPLVHDRRPHPRDHDHADRHRRSPRETFATVPQSQKDAALRARRHPLGDDPRRGVPAQPQRHRRGGDHRPRPGDGRDDRRGAGDRVEPADHAPSSSRPGDTMAAVIANEFGEATGTLPVRADRPRRRAVRASRS